MDYSVHMQARSEYEHRARSFRPVPEFGHHILECKSGKRPLSLLWLRPILTALLHFVIR